MKNLIYLTAMLLISGCSFLPVRGAAMQTISANSANITRIGRWSNTTVGATPVIANISGGNRIRFRFTGVSVGVTFDTTPSYLDLTGDTSGDPVYGTVGNPITYYPEYEYRIDGGAWVRNTVQTNISVSGLSTGIHTFELWSAGLNIFCNKWNTLAGIRVSGITIADLATISPWPTYLPKMLVIGDSIGEGMLAIYGTPYTGNQPSTHSGRQDFAGQLSDLIGVELWTHAFGGSAFSNTGPGQIPPTATNYLYKSNGIAKDDPDFLIVMIEATNNGSADSAHLASLISQIKSDQPAATIFVLDKLYPNPASQSWVQTTASAAGVQYIDPSAWSYSRTGSSHPDLAGSTSIANYLQPVIAPFVPIVASLLQSESTLPDVTLVGTVEPQAAASTSTLVTATITGNLAPSAAQSASTIGQADLTGVMAPSAMLSLSDLSQIEMMGIITPEPIYSTSTIAGLTIVEVNSGGGSIRSPDGGAIRIYSADGYEIDTYRYVNEAWQK
jgi:hypothetical protein